MPNKKSPSSEAIDHSTSAVSITKINNLLKPSSSSSSAAAAAAAVAVAPPSTATQRSNTSSQFASGSIGKNSSLGKEKQTNANAQHFDRYNLTADKLEKKSSAKARKKHQSSGSDIDYDNENISPLYSNWDQETHEHLLPLQHYIIEQAKLSGSYHLGGDALDSDSLHSDSQSEHSFSGHEPDNEDSDHSDGDYLTHHYSSAMDEYGEVYYNVHTGFDRNPKQDNMFVSLPSSGSHPSHSNKNRRNYLIFVSHICRSEEVENKLERECGQIYSPIKNHPYFQQKEVTATVIATKPSPQRQMPPAIDTSRSLQSSQKQMLQQQQQQQQHHQQQHQLHQQQHQPHQQPKLPPFLQMHQKNAPNFEKTFALPPPSGGGITQLPIMKECNIEKFAQDNLNLHSKGLFRKKSSLRDMLSWTPDTISRPMLAVSRDKSAKKMATEMFKLVQIYMGDRKARDGMSLNSVAMDIIGTALAQPPLRDELYIQLCRQTTENHIRESLIRGWELLTICLSFLPPSPTFQPALLK